MTQLPLSIFIVPLIILLIFMAIPLLAMRNKKPGSIGSYLRYGRSEAKKRIGSHWLPLVVIAVVLCVLIAIQSIRGTVMTGAVDQQSGLEAELNTLGMIIQLIITVFGLVYGIGMIKMGLHSVDDKPYKFGDMFSHSWKQLWKYVVSAFLFSLLMFVPVIALGIFFLVVNGSDVSDVAGIVFLVLGFVAIVWALYVAMRVGLVLYYVVVDHADTMGPVALIRHAWDVSQGHIGKLFGTSFVAGLTNLLGMLALGVGLLWTIPLTQIAMAKLYREIDDAYHKDNALEA